jgi:hypothetical protein
MDVLFGIGNKITGGAINKGLQPITQNNDM